jgi:hypothetical protein
MFAPEISNENLFVDFESVSMVTSRFELVQRTVQGPYVL